MAKNINARDETGHTALFNAVSDESLKRAKKLLAQGADPNIPETNGITPLMDAAESGNLAIVELLLANGADPYLLDMFGDCALDYAGREVNTKIVEMLRSRTDPQQMQLAIAARERALADERERVARLAESWPATETRDVWYASQNGELIGIGLSEDDARQYADPSSGPITCESKREVLCIVTGTLANWGDENHPAPHVSWECPACRETHDTDVRPEETHPTLWFCENGVGDGKFLVRWRD